MFEKYTEKARRVIFFARYEAGEFGSNSIETEHLLLGLLREDRALVSSLLPANVSMESLRARIEAQVERKEKIMTSVELRLSDESREVLIYAAEESNNLRHSHIGPEHLLLGLLHVTDSLAEKVLRENGVNSSTVRQQIDGSAGDV